MSVVCWSRSSDLGSGCHSCGLCGKQGQHHDAEPGLGSCFLPTYVISNCSRTQGYMWRTCFNRLFQHEGYRLSWQYTQTHPEPSRKPPNCFQLCLPRGSGSITPNENIVWRDRAAQENWTATSSMALQDFVCRGQPSTIFTCI